MYLQKVSLIYLVQGKQPACKQSGGGVSNLYATIDASQVGYGGTQKGPVSPEGQFGTTW